MPSIRVLLAEDHTIVRKGIRSLLDEEPGIEVVGEAEDGREAVDKVEQLVPDVVLMDISMPTLNGLEATRQIVKHWPEVKVLILTMYTDEEYIFQFLRAGAAGYLVKKTAPTELILAIYAVYRGESFLSPAISKTVIEEYIRHAGDSAPEDDYDKLTDREREVLQLLAEGFTTKEVAHHLHISVKTAGVHRTNLMDKLDLHNLSDITRYAIRKGIISLD
jgi:DNA-binding NarL/FixJ family response regulator